MFKKRKINNIKSNKKNNVIVRVFGVLAILFIFIIALSTLDFLNKNDFFIKKSGTEIQTDNSNVETSIVGVFSNILNTSKSGSIIKGEIKKDIYKKTNILLLGRGGVGHEAPNLTDTIILVSINSESETITMLSIPRDFYVVDKDGKGGKINQIYALNRYKGEEIGIGLLKNHVEQITGEKIDFYVNVDFNGFINFIDAIGGININVPNTLVDRKYPDGNWGYRTMIIKKGEWLFDGDTALKYARSRHSTSDFDRSLRQQQIVSSIKDKLSEGGIFSKLNKATKFYDIFTKYIYTDIKITDLKDIFENYINLSTYEVLSFNLNDSCFYGDPACKKGGFLYIPDRDLYGGASVLLPNGAYLGNLSDYSELHKFTKLIFNNSKIYKENIQINILNSTKKIGIAGDLATTLKRYGFYIPDNNSIGNIKDKEYKKSVVYYNSYIKDSETLKFLKNVLKVEFIEQNGIKYGLDDLTMIEIVLGDDYEEVLSYLENNL